MNSDDEDDDAADDGGYLLGESDVALLTQAGRLLERAMLAPNTDWATKVSLAKLLHVICRLPNKSAELNLEVTFTSPRELYGEEEIYFYLSLGVEDELLNVKYGGHYYHPRSGGDSFSVFAWSAQPGFDADWIDYSESVGVVVTALVDPTDVLHAMPDMLERCEIDVLDDENSLIGDEAMGEPPLIATPACRSSNEPDKSEAPPVDDSDAEDDIDEAGPVVIDPITAADRRLIELVGPGSTCSTSASGAYGIENCDGCGVDLSTVGLFVDGSSTRGGWGNYCASCCFRHGVAVGWGKGQLYARQPDGSWKGIAGFKPE